MNDVKRIFIVGHSGAGKGVLAQALAEKLGWQFIDADFALASTIGRDMDEIIGDQGEKSFQHCLSEILSNQLGEEGIVVTTDDSIIDRKKNREMLATEFAVYLQVSTKVQLKRISHNRPLLPVDDYELFLNKLHDERDALYEEVASMIINSDDNNLDKHVSSIIKEMNK